MLFDIFAFMAVAFVAALPLVIRRRMWDVLLFVVAGAVIGLLVNWAYPNHPLVEWWVPVLLPIGWTVAMLVDWQRNPVQRTGLRPVTSWMAAWAAAGWVQALAFLALTGRLR